jgi:F0F1-type ATP synthase assembly protein I
MKKIQAEIYSRLIGIFFGILIGAFFGSGTGVVGSFGGEKGVIVFAVIGGIVGFFIVPDAVRCITQIVNLRNKTGKK